MVLLCVVVAVKVHRSNKYCTNSMSDLSPEHAAMRKESMQVRILKHTFVGLVTRLVLSAGPSWFLLILHTSRTGPLNFLVQSKIQTVVDQTVASRHASTQMASSICRLLCLLVDSRLPFIPALSYLHVEVCHCRSTICLVRMVRRRISQNLPLDFFSVGLTQIVNVLVLLLKDLQEHGRAYRSRRRDGKENQPQEDKEGAFMEPPAATTSGELLQVLALCFAVVPIAHTHCVSSTVGLSKQSPPALLSYRLLRRPRKHSQCCSTGDGRFTTNSIPDCVGSSSHIFILQ